MKLFLATFALFAVVAYTSALPIESEATHLADVDTGLMMDSEMEITRNRRFTCDVFSFESDVLTPNHAACATKCIFENRKGGHCEGTTCICRNEKVIESLP